jgi:hypothetical protein
MALVVRWSLLVVGFVVWGLSVGGLGALALGTTLILVAPSSKKADAPTVGLAFGGPGGLGGATVVGAF